MDKRRTPIVEGLGASKGISTGRVLFLDDMEDSPVDVDTILVADTIPPTVIEFSPSIKGFVTDEGGLLSHAATVAREIMIPCVVGTGNATQVLCSGDLIEVVGDEGKVFYV